MSAIQTQVLPGPVDVGALNQRFQDFSAQQRVAWAVQKFPGQHILSSSFGAQAAVALHLVLREKPDIPVVLIDTGYLFPETYQFIDELTQRLSINLQVFRARVSPAWQEARFGERWQQGFTGITDYNYENKVVPMKNALQSLAVGTWFAGLRRVQSESREFTPFVEHLDGLWKVHPIADWSDKDVFDYLQKHDLPYHPLWHEGYLSIGDEHTSQSVHEVDDAEQMRFFGIKRECGIHEIGRSGL